MWTDLILRSGFVILITAGAITSCTSKGDPKGSSSKRHSTDTSGLVLNEEQALRLAQLPLKCLQQEYPNKLGQVLNSGEELRSPSSLHPAFYGCFDWHSSVHGHWLLVRLLKSYPSLSLSDKIRNTLSAQLTSENIAEELKFFQTRYNESFERTYGWAWILKLQLELDTWKDSQASKWAENLRPLTTFIVKKYQEYLPKLVYPIRTGEHINTAFGLAFAHDYALHVKDREFQRIIEKKARTFYGEDRNSPLSYEPSGYDFLSPTFEEIDLMRRILDEKEFNKWIHAFLPQLKNLEFDLEPGKVSDRTDGKLVHLDGLNFSRAWCMYGLARQYHEFAHLRVIADKHMKHSMGMITDGDYMGEHWLASFALYALAERK